MSNSYSLDDLKRDLDREFAPLTIQVGDDSVVLRNLMRMNKKDRDAVIEALNELDKLDPEQDQENMSVEEMATITSVLDTVFEKIAADGKGKKLVAAIDGDLALSMRILEMWTEATQPGEAENSPA